MEMQRLRSVMESAGCTHVSTYVNSGNVLFESEEEKREIHTAVSALLAVEFCFEIPLLLKSEAEIKQIAEAIPENWQNNQEQKTDVAYLFPEADSESIVAEIPLKREYADIIYTKGALIWHILKKNYNKSRLNTLIGKELYQHMTVRNVNTARFLAGRL